MKYQKLLVLWVAMVAGHLVPVKAAPLIINHTAVDLWTNLTAADIARVKKMWAVFPGQSHSLGFEAGCQLLQSNVDNRFQVNAWTYTGPPLPYSTNYLRVSRTTFNPEYTSFPAGTDESSWYTNPVGISNMLAGLSYFNTNGYGLSVIGLAWSWTLSWHNVSTVPDPNYEVYWAGSSHDGPDGDRAWGLNAEAYPYTSNHVSMDTYLNATEGYRDYCRSNDIPTVVVFTTAPVDYSVDTAYQCYLKNNYIRDYVAHTTNGVLFDYADILCWDSAGHRATNAWTDLGGNHDIYEWIAADNYSNLDGTVGGNDYHIGQIGAIRVAKALWYMLARLSAPPTNLTLSATADSATNVTLQWPSALTQTYSILRSSNLITWNVVASNLAGMYPSASYTIPDGHLNQAFFRIDQQ